MAVPHRRKLFLVLIIAPLFTSSYIEKIFAIGSIPLYAKLSLYCLWQAFCVLLYYLTTPFDPLGDLPQPPPAKSIIGHARKLIFQMPKGSGFLEWTDNVPNSGLVYYNLLPFGLGPSLLLTSPEALQEAMVTKSYEFEKTSADRKLLQSFIGRGLITVEGSEHKVQRRSVTPAFSGKQINDLIVPIFWAKSKELADIFAGQLHTSPVGKDGSQRTGIVDVNSWASHVTLDIIGLACVGKDFGTMYNTDNELVKHWETILKPDENRGVAVVFELINIFVPSRIARRIPFVKHVREAAVAKEQLRILCKELLDAKRRDMENEASRQIDILSTLIRSGQFTDDGLIDQLLTFLAAGHETTAGALIWTLYLLAINPSVQDRLRQELRTHFAAGTEQNEQVMSLGSLPYLNAVIDEQLRLLPIVPTTGRTTAKDTTLLGHVVPKGTIIITAPWAINRSKRHWGHDAEEFKPERWLAENASGNKKGPMSMITFLHGPRSCIGQAFSKAELRCLIVAMVLRFDMAVADPTEVVEPVGLITIKPKNGMKLLLKELL